MSSPEPSILEYLSFRLDRLCEMTRNASSDFYEREFGIGVRDLRVLRFVALEPGLTLTRLIELVMLEKTVTSKLVTSLSRQGLLRRQIGETDARQVNLFLTSDGKALVTRSYKVGNVMEKLFLATLSDAEVKTLNRCIDKLTESVKSYKVKQRTD